VNLGKPVTEEWLQKQTWIGNCKQATAAAQWSIRPSVHQWRLFQTTVFI